MLFQGKKKGISEMIGYILLITIGIAMSAIVFVWLKGYVPTESIECTEGVSLFVKSYTYDCNSGRLTITLKNNGRFALSGYLIHATTQAGEELATRDLSSFFDASRNGALEQGESSGWVFNGEIKFGTDLAAIDNSFPPSSEDGEQTRIQMFVVDNLGGKKIEIVPTRYEIINGKQKPATCTKARVKQDIEC